MNDCIDYSSILPDHLLLKILETSYYVKAPLICKKWMTLFENKEQYLKYVKLCRSNIEIIKNRLIQYSYENNFSAIKSIFDNEDNNQIKNALTSESHSIYEDLICYAYYKKHYEFVVHILKYYSDDLYLYCINDDGLIEILGNAMKNEQFDIVILLIEKFGDNFLDYLDPNGIFEWALFKTKKDPSQLIINLFQIWNFYSEDFINLFYEKLDDVDYKPCKQIVNIMMQEMHKLPPKIIQMYFDNAIDGNNTQLKIISLLLQEWPMPYTKKYLGGKFFKLFDIVPESLDAEFVISLIKSSKKLSVSNIKIKLENIRYKKTNMAHDARRVERDVRCRARRLVTPTHRFAMN